MTPPPSFSAVVVVVVVVVVVAKAHRAPGSRRGASVRDALHDRRPSRGRRWRARNRRGRDRKRCMYRRGRRGGSRV
jgi:hypothetical protein